MAQEGDLSGSRLTPTVKPQRVYCKLDKAIKMPYSDILTHTLKMCKGTPSNQRMPGYQG
jgi:hypothetical protein